MEGVAVSVSVTTPVVDAEFEETLAARLHYLKDEIQDAQVAFDELEGDDAEMAFRVYNADWGAFAETDWYGQVEKTREGRMSMGPNWLVPIADQILVSLLGKGVGMAVVPQHPAQMRYTTGLTQILAGVLDQCEWRTLLSTSLIHIALGRRAVFKTGWRCGVDGKRPDVELIRHNRFWFDLEALTPKRCSFMVELRMYSLAEFRRRFEKAKLDISCEEFCAIQPQCVPTKYSSHGWFGEQAARQREKRVMVYEHYDFYRREITFILADVGGEPNKILCRVPLVRCPYVVATFSPNGMDARGQSEAVNILRQQRNLDFLSDRVTVAMNASKSGLVVDGRFINKVEVAKLANQPDVTIFRMEVQQGQSEQAPGDIRQYIMPAPQFTVPDALWAMQEKIEKDIALTTAFAEIQQGRAAGFRSATEASIADSNLRGRIAHKSGSWHDALIAVAQEMLWLLGSFHEAEFIPIHVANSGEAKWDVMRIPTCLMRLPLACRIDAYNPVSQNPLVIAETLQNLMPLLQQLPDVNWRNLVETLLILMGLPLDLLKPPGQVKLEAAKAEQGGQGAGQGASPPLDMASLAAALGGGGGGAPGAVPGGMPGAVPGLPVAPAAPVAPPAPPLPPPTPPV